MAPACEPSGRRVGVGSATARQVHDGSGAWRAITAAMVATIITFKQACLLRLCFDAHNDDSSQSDRDDVPFDTHLSGENE